MTPVIYNISNEDYEILKKEWYDSIKLMPCDFLIEEVSYE